MPDRELTKIELNELTQEHNVEKVVFKALEVFAQENTQPSLHDLCIVELGAKLDGTAEILIQQGRKINALTESVKLLLKERGR